MARSIFNDITISGIAVVLGENEHIIDNDPLYYSNDPEKLIRLKQTIGVNKRYWAKNTTTACDLCKEAAESLIKKLNFCPTTLDAIISVTQTPDYYMPGNAHILHSILNLSKNTIALDIELGCSGYIYGLWLAFMMINSGLEKVLLLAGDTLSKVISLKDSSVAPIFSDAGSATLIERKNVGKSFFLLKSDGKGFDKVYQPAGAYRQRSTSETRLTRKIGNSDSEASLENMLMKGFDVFSFTLSEQPVLFNELIQFSGKSLKDLDFIALHQANNYITNTITKKLKVSPEKIIPPIFSDFGNQVSASIPALLCNAFKGKSLSANILLQGFGTGFSWGGCIMNFDNVLCLKPKIYGKD